MAPILMFCAAACLVTVPSGGHRYSMMPAAIYSFGLHRSWREQIELRYRIQTQWEDRISWEWLSLYPLYVLALFGLIYTWDILALVFLAFLPIAILEFRRVMVRRRIDQGIVLFLDMLNARMAVHGNLYDALTQVEQTLKSPEICRVLKRFNFRLRLLGNRIDAFRSVQREVHHPYLKYIFMNLEHIADCWGDGIDLLREIENDYISIQTELNRSRTELENDRWMTYFGMILMFYTASQILYKNPVISSYFVRHPLLLGLFALLAASGVWILVRSGRTL